MGGQECHLTLESPVLFKKSSRPGSSRSLQGYGVLSKGTSRLLRIGAGWVVSGGAGVSAGGYAPQTQLAPFTCVAETECAVFELSYQSLRTLREEDPSAAFALLDLTAHFN